MSADEIAAIAIDEGWLRAPSAAVVPATIINNAIRAHIKRCTTATPPRPALLMKHQLAGSVNESVLESALHPAAFSGQARPKGTVWFLAPMGKTKWKNPFAGIEVPKLPPRKPGPPKRVKEIRAKPAPKPRAKAQSPAPAAAPVKIRLVLGGQNPGEEEGNTEEASIIRRGTPSRQDGLGGLMLNRLPSCSRARDALDLSDDDSVSSDSDMDLDVGPSRMTMSSKLKDDRSAALPLSITHSRNAVPPFLTRTSGTSLLDWGNALPPAFPNQTNHIFPQPPGSPFPSHSLDNTTWTVRRDLSHSAAFETSSASSDDDLREPGDWGMSSGILVQAEAEADGQDAKPIWTAEDEEAKVKEATDALRVLFPMTSPDEQAGDDPQLPLNQLDNRPSTPDSAHSSRSLSRIARGPLKSADIAASIALAAWAGNSSPVASPNLRHTVQALPETSPTQHLSKLHTSFDSADMEVDEWLDEAGELPVKAEDALSDIDLGSNVGDLPTPEHDRQLHTAAWAREAAASTLVKEEISDYPSPMPTEADDSRVYRAESMESQTPSSGLSELPPFELDYECVTKPDIEEVLVGPESISMEELDGYLPSMSGRPEKTPQRGRYAKGKFKKDQTPCGLWGGIGVGMLMSSLSPGPHDTLKRSPVVRRRSSKTRLSRRTSSSRPVPLSSVESLPTPPTDDEAPMKAQSDCADLEFEAIGPADFDAACAEAEAREEKHRRACKEKADRQKAILEAYDQSVKERQIPSQSNDVTPSEQWDGGISPWSDLTCAPWGTSSTDSLGSLGTPGVLSPMALHGMSMLSLDTPRMYQSMDPKALLSPPLVPTPGMLDEVMSQVEVDAAMASVNSPPVAACPLETPNSPTPVAASAPAATPSTCMPAQGAVAKISAPANVAPALAPALGHAMVSTASTPVVSPSPASTPAPTASSPPSLAPPVTRAASTSVSPKPASSTSVSAPQPIKSASQPGRARLSPPGSEGPRKSVSPTANGSVPTKSQGTITKPLCTGVDACVVDNIPVYAHVWENKGIKHTLLRRLDTDFVNATSLLSALGVPVADHAEHLNAPSPWLASHLTVPTVCNTGVAFSAGVPGVWVQFAEARALAKKLQLPEGNFLSNILREDLFQLFAVLATINPEHSPSDTFGLPFVAGRVGHGNGQSNSNSSSLGSSATSRSTPNLPSLSSSAPSSNHLRGANGHLKGPLVRSTPATPADPGPHPKRRRATTCIIGEVAPLSKIAPAAPTTSSHTNPGSTTNTPVRKPPPRAARPSSLLSETPRSKVAAK